MSSTLIPAQDLVPSVSSRVVTIDATSMLEATPDGEHWVDFILPQDLHVAADDKIIMAGSERVTLTNGKGSIRLPTYDPDAKTVDGSTDWVILVKKSWTGKSCGHGRGCGCGGAYAIRVPIGTSNISLADLPTVRELTVRERIWAVTGASVNVTTGSTAGGSVSLSGGILNFNLTVPSGEWDRGILSTGSNLADVLPGVYRIPTASAAESITPTIPEEYRSPSVLTVMGTDNYRMVELSILSGRSAPDPVIRNEYWGYTGTGWKGWRRVDPGAVETWTRGLLAAGTDLNTLLTPGVYYTSGWSLTNSLLNRPTTPSDTNGPVAIEVLQAGSTARVQRWNIASAPSEPPGTLERRRSANGVWSTWRSLGTGGSGTDSSAILDAVSAAYSPLGHTHDGAYVTPQHMTSELDSVRALAETEAQSALGQAQAYADSIVTESTAVTPEDALDAAVQRAVIAGKIPSADLVPASGAARADRAAVRPSDHGAAVDGVTDDSAAILAAAAEAVARSVPLELGASHYGISERMNLPPGLSIVSNGAELVALRDNSDFMMKLDSRTTLSGRLHLTLGTENVTRSRGLLVEGSDVSVDTVSVTSPVDDAGNGSQLSAGIQVSGDRISIGFMRIQGFRYPLRVQLSEGVDIRRVEIDGYVRGIYLRGVTKSRIGAATIARSFVSERAPGYSSILLESTEDHPTSDLTLENLNCRDAAASAIRFGGQTPIRRVTIRDAVVANSGTAALKILGGQLDAGSIHEDIRIEGLTVQDAGQTDTNSGAVLVHLARRVFIRNLVVTRLVKPASVTAGVEIQGSSDVHIVSPVIRDTGTAAIWVRGNLGDSDGVRVEGGSLRSATGDGLRIETGTATARDVVITGNPVIETPNGAHYHHVSGTAPGGFASWIGGAGQVLAGDVGAVHVNVLAPWSEGGPVARKGSRWITRDGTEYRSSGAGWQEF